ncbi:MAG: cell division protein ZapA [bacterium]
MNRATQLTEVIILDEKYTIRSEANSEEVKRVAHYLDTKLKEIRQKLPNISLVKAVILAAFYNIEELFETKAQLKETKKIMEDKTKNILKMLEDV